MPESPAPASTRWFAVSCVFVPVVWSVGAAVGYAMFPATDTAAVVAEGIWICGVLLWWGICAAWASSRFYIGSGKGIARQSVSQSGNFREGH